MRGSLDVLGFRIQWKGKQGPEKQPALHFIADRSIRTAKV